jgi:hypothetical protein
MYWKIFRRLFGKKSEISVDIDENHVDKAINKLRNNKLHFIMHQIRNLQILTDEQISQVKTMNADELLEIILVYNDMFETVQTLIDN